MSEENEFRFELIPIGIGYRCPYCKEGEMKFDIEGKVLPEFPSQLPHKCTKCNKQLHLPKQYPYIDWRPGKELPPN